MKTFLVIVTVFSSSFEEPKQYAFQSNSQEYCVENAEYVVSTIEIALKEEYKDAQVSYSCKEN